MPRTGLRPLCSCGDPVRSKGKTDTGLKIWGRYCWKCTWNTYRQYKKTYCEMCGFHALHTVQLDVDHIDGDHTNNHLDNLQTLCANCHRLKTQLNRDHMPNKNNLANLETLQIVLPFYA